jgi:hypothetical protein
MPTHPEERRIAGLLRELIVQSGTSLEGIEERLGWQPGRLTELLDGRVRLSFEDVLEILPLLNATPADFFAWLYGFDPGETGMIEGTLPSGLPAESSGQERVTDRRFEKSLRVVKQAIARRFAWKEERAKAKSEEGSTLPEEPPGD